MFFTFSIVFCFFHIPLDRFVFFAIIYIWFLVLHGAIWRFQKPLHLRGEDKDKGYVPTAAGTVVFEVMIALLETNLCQARSRPQMWQNDVSCFFCCHALTDADPSSTFHGERLDGLENQLVIRKPGDLQAEFSAKHLAAEWSESKWT